MKKSFITLSSIVLVGLPFLTSAQVGSGFNNLFAQATDIVNKVIPFIIALTVLVFLWGIFMFVLSTDEDKRKEAKGYMIWGIIALAVMVSVWGLVRILTSSLNLDNTAPLAPQLPRAGGYVNVTTY